MNASESTLTADIVLACGRGGETLRKNLDALPLDDPGVKLYIADGARNLGASRSIQELAIEYGADCVRYEYPTEAFTATESYARTIDRGDGDIIIRMDADTLLPKEPRGAIMERLNAIFNAVYNAIIYPVSMEARTSGMHHIRIAYGQTPAFSSGMDLRPHWSLQGLDGNWIIRRDFLYETGGPPRGAGYGHCGMDVAHRVMRAGGGVILTPDFTTLHHEHDAPALSTWARIAEEEPLDAEELSRLKANFRWIHPDQKALLTQADANAVPVVAVGADELKPQ